MKRNVLVPLHLFMAVFLLSAVSTASGEKYEGIASMKSAKIIFDERESDPKAAASHLKLVHQTYKDPAAMKKDGIKSEVCLVAAKFFEVDPASILPEIKRVENGWISSTVHQAQGYSLVPVY